ncbi:MAG TPA: invasin domain 3-containing protein, partial [Gemmatimonadaceae bacterium]|nr:invasin domain 3-containing protein [Gemmatimonadaceae bacterium]
ITSASPTVTVGAACTAGPVSLTTTELTINDTTVAQNPVAALTLPSGVTTTLTLRVRDADGCPVTQPHRVAFSVAGGGSTGVLGATADLLDGRYIATFTGERAGSAATISATIDDVPITSRAVAVTVVPGDVSTRTSLVSASQTNAAPGDTVVLTLRTRDAAGNALLRGGRMVSFVVVGSNPKGVTTVAVDNRDGTYTAKYVSPTAGSESIVALIEGTKVAQGVIVTVIGQ